MAPCEEIIRSHLNALADDFSCMPLSDSEVALTLPYTYADGDHVELVAVLRGDRLTFTDDGEALSRLELAGVDPDSKAVAHRLGTLLKQLPVEHVESGLFVEGTADDAPTLIMAIVSAMREIDSLQALRPRPRPVPFERRLLSHLNAVAQATQEHPRITGVSGTQYRLTAAVGEERPIYVQAVAGGSSVGGARAVNHAFRAFYDINGQLEPSQKLAVLSNEDRKWREGDITLLEKVAFVAGWWDRDALDTFLLGGRQPADRLLFASQPQLEDVPDDGG